MGKVAPRGPDGRAPEEEVLPAGLAHAAEGASPVLRGALGSQSGRFLPHQGCPGEGARGEDGVLARAGDQRHLPPPVLAARGSRASGA